MTSGLVQIHGAGRKIQGPNEVDELQRTFLKRKKEIMSKCNFLRLNKNFTV